jgi:5-methylcytosine-specific restriction endonuclease McrA
MAKMNTPLRRRQKLALWKAQQGQCLDCGAFHAYRCSMTIDHIVPVSKGGGNELSNLRLVCWKCNNRRGNRPARWFSNPVVESAVTD